jgi:hypothetical protein
MPRVSGIQSGGFAAIAEQFLDVLRLRNCPATKVTREGVADIQRGLRLGRAAGQINHNMDGLVSG